jgi:hypothetical protein
VRRLHLCVATKAPNPAWRYELYRVRLGNSAAEFSQTSRSSRIHTYLPGTQQQTDPNRYVFVYYPSKILSTYQCCQYSLKGSGEAKAGHSKKQIGPNWKRFTKATDYLRSQDGVRVVDVGFVYCDDISMVHAAQRHDQQIDLSRPYNTHLQAVSSRHSAWKKRKCSYLGNGWIMTVLLEIDQHGEEGISSFPLVKLRMS